jgi:hypothetical protein
MNLPDRKYEADIFDKFMSLTNVVEEDRCHDFDDIIYDISLISEEEKQRILEIENSKLVKCFKKESNLSLTAKFELFDMLLHRTNLV